MRAGGRALLLVALAALLLLMGCGQSEPQPTPTADPIVMQGQQVFTQQCAICHATTPNVVVRGPSLHQIAVRAGEQVAGQDARSYLYKSILQPDAYMVEGYENIMPGDFGRKLTGEDLDAVVAYLLTLE